MIVAAGSATQCLLLCSLSLQRFGSSLFLLRFPFPPFLSMASLLTSVVELLVKLAQHYERVQDNSVDLKRLCVRLHNVAPAVQALQSRIQCGTARVETYSGGLQSLLLALEDARSLISKHASRSAAYRFLTANAVADKVDRIDQRISVAVMDLTLVSVTMVVETAVQSSSQASSAKSLAKAEPFCPSQTASAPSVAPGSVVSSPMPPPVASRHGSGADWFFFGSSTPSPPSLPGLGCRAARSPPLRRLVLWFDVSATCAKLAERFTAEDQAKANQQRTGQASTSAAANASSTGGAHNALSAAPPSPFGELDDEYVPLQYLYFSRPVDLLRHMRTVVSASPRTERVVALVSSFTSPEMNRQAAVAQAQADGVAPVDPFTNPHLSSLEMVRLCMSLHLRAGLPKPVLVTLSGQKATFDAWAGVSDIRMAGTREFRAEMRTLLDQRNLLEETSEEMAPPQDSEPHLALAEPIPASCSSSAVPKDACALLLLALVDASTGLCVKGARVSLEGQWTLSAGSIAPIWLPLGQWLSDASGSVSFPPLRPASYRISLKMQGETSAVLSPAPLRISNSSVTLELVAGSRVLGTLTVAPCSLHLLLKLDRPAVV